MYTILCLHVVWHSYYKRLLGYKCVDVSCQKHNNIHHGMCKPSHFNHPYCPQHEWTICKCHEPCLTLTPVQPVLSMVIWLSFVVKVLTACTRVVITWLCAHRCVHERSPGQVGPVCPIPAPAHTPVPGCTRSTRDTKVNPPPFPPNDTRSVSLFSDLLPVCRAKDTNYLSPLS